jgi:hypothetical protein
LRRRGARNQNTGLVQAEEVVVVIRGRNAKSILVSYVDKLILILIVAVYSKKCLIRILPAALILILFVFVNILLVIAVALACPGHAYMHSSNSKG